MTSICPRWMPAACVVVLSLVFVGCGDGDEGRGATPAAVGAPLPAPPANRSGTGFPATIAHGFGIAEVKRQPRRIVTVGVNDQDTVLALGEQPVAVADWGSREPSGTRSWSRMLLRDPKPKVLDAGNGVDVSAIAALKPDLIVATNANLTSSLYNRLAKIAPTLGPDQNLANGDATPWPASAEGTAAALGRMDQVDALIADTRKRFAAVAKGHAGFRSRTATLVVPGDDGKLVVYPDPGVDDPLAMLGFRANPKLPSVGAPQTGPLEIEADPSLLDTDVVVVAAASVTSRAGQTARPDLAALDGLKPGRVVFADEALTEALRFASPLSMRFVLDQLTPLLEQAVRGVAPSSPQPGGDDA